MNIPGLILEYLITGASAMIWLLPVLKHMCLYHPSDKTDTALLVPVLYIFGMIVDGIALFLVSKRVLNIKNWIIEKQDMEEGLDGIKKFFKEHSATERELERIGYSTEVAKEMQWRSSRDRIARGAILNGIFAAITLPFIYKSWLVLLIALGLTVILFFVWVQFQKKSNKFEYRAHKLIVTKQKDGGAGK